MDPARFVFLDETGASTNMVRRYGWGPRGERLVDAAPHGHWHTTTFVAAILLFTSGGKDSLCCLLRLLELGADPARIELHHHEVDGRGPAFMDWPVTAAYVAAVTDAFKLPPRPNASCPPTKRAWWSASNFGTSWTQSVRK